MSVEETIRKKLTEAFSPTHLDVIDDSESHRGHGGWREGGETHFQVVIAAPSLTGLNRVAQHRRINAALAEELAGPVHALEIRVL